MRKVMLILLSLSLVSCSTKPQVSPSPITSETPMPSEVVEYKLTEKQIEQLNMVIYSGGFFDDVIVSTDDLNYTVDNDKIIVTIDKPKKMEIQFTVDGTALYDYPLEDTQITYTKEKKDKTATLTSVYTRAININNTRIRSTLTTSDNQEFKIVFNQLKNSFENNGTPDIEPGTFTFVDSLSKEMYSYYINAWNDILLFDSYMQTLNVHITNIFKNEETYTFKNKDSLVVDNTNLYDFGKLEKKQSNEQTFTEKPIRTKFLSDFYSYSFNGEETKTRKGTSAYLNTLFLFFFIKSSADIPIEELTAATFSIKPEYHCMGKLCNKSTDNSELRISQGTYGEGYYTVSTIDYFNQQIKDIFDYPAYEITKTKMIDNGIVQSVEEKTLVGEAYAGDGPLNYNGAIYESFKEDGVDYVTLTPYIVRNTINTNQPGTTFDVYTTAGDKIGSNLIQSEIHTFVVNHKDSFLTWDIALTPGNNKDFYKVLSFSLK